MIKMTNFLVPLSLIHTLISKRMSRAHRVRQMPFVIGYPYLFEIPRKIFKHQRGACVPAPGPAHHRRPSEGRKQQKLPGQSVNTGVSEIRSAEARMRLARRAPASSKKNKPRKTWRLFAESASIPPSPHSRGDDHKQGATQIYPVTDFHRAPLHQNFDAPALEAARGKLDKHGP